MGTICLDQSPVKIFCAVMAADRQVIEDALQRLSIFFGPVDLMDEPYAFDEFTSYYASEFGEGLVKQVVAYRSLRPMEGLVEAKHWTNDLERAFGGAEGRSVNIDPGYLNLSKVVLASTKDHWHRLYVGRGIFEELTLTYRKKGGQYHPLEWTYPDYATENRLAFFARVREAYKKQLAEMEK